MRHPAFAVAAVVLLMLHPVDADEADVVVQAGHQGRPESCEPLHVKHCNLGASNGAMLERKWTPVVADAAAAALRGAGLHVLRRPADWAGHDTARAAIFLHFDGSPQPCSSGASVGFPKTTDASFVHDWEQRYRAIFPFHFVGENISENEREYYGFRKVSAPGKAMLIEFGEMTCPAQAHWMASRLHELGIDLARFLSAELHAPAERP
jgi:hypothetical protein